MLLRAEEPASLPRADRHHDRADRAVQIEVVIEVLFLCIDVPQAGHSTKREPSSALAAASGALRRAALCSLEWLFWPAATSWWCCESALLMSHTGARVLIDVIPCLPGCWTRKTARIAVHNQITRE